MDIKRKIKEKGFTISQIAAQMTNNRTGQIGMSQGSLSTILSGNPTVGTLSEIANILGISLSELVSDEETKESTSAVFSCPHCGAKLSIRIEAEPK